MSSLVINTINTTQIGPPGVNGRAENIASSLAQTGILCQFENRKNKEANHIMIRNIKIFLSKEIPYASGSNSYSSGSYFSIILDLLFILP